MVTYVNKLMNGRQSPHNSIITYTYMAGYIYSIGNYSMLAYMTVMCYVGISHYQCIIFNSSLHFIDCPLVDSGIFPNGNIITYNNKRILTRVLKILWDSRNYTSGENFTVSAYPCPLHNGYMRANPGSFTNFNIVMN